MKYFLLLVFSSCTSFIDYTDFDTSGFDKEMSVRFIRDDKFCRTLQSDFKKKFGFGSVAYSQCMYERGYRFKNARDY